MRMYEGTLFGRPIKDWKHTDAPEGTAPHRPVLGVPVPEPVLERLREEQRARLGVTRATVERKIQEPPLVPPRPAAKPEIPQSVGRMLIISGEEGWTVVEPVTYFQSSDSREHLVAKFRRRDLGAVGCWERRPGKQWAFESGWTLVGTRVGQVGSEQLKSWLRQRDEECITCGRSSAAHNDDEECGT